MEARNDVDYSQYDTVNYDEVVRAGNKVGRLTVKDPCEKNLRILPPINPGLFYVEYGAHYDVPGLIPAAPMEAVACLKLTLGQACPLCAEVRRLYAEADLGVAKDKVKQDKANRHRGKVRFAMNVVDCDHPETGVQVWDVNKETFEKVRKQFLKNRFVVSPHPEKGRALNVTFTRKAQWVAPDGVQLAEERDPYMGSIPLADWPEKRADLDEYVKRFTVTAVQMREWASESACLETQEIEHAPQVTIEDHSSNGNGAITEEVYDVLPEDALEDPELKQHLARLRARKNKKA